MLPLLSARCPGIGSYLPALHETLVAFDEIPEPIEDECGKWAAQYAPVHAVAHWEDSQRKTGNYDQAYDVAADEAERLLGVVARDIMPKFLDHYAAACGKTRTNAFPCSPRTSSYETIPAMIRWLFRWLFRLLILLVVLVAAAILLLDTIAREITEHRIQQRTGLEARIGRMHVGLLEPRLTIENLVIYNGVEFGGSPLLEMPELHLECDRNPLFSANYHFKLVRFNLARLNVVEDTKGRNLDMLEKKLNKSNGPVITQPILKKKTTGTNAFPQIDALNLSLGRATYINLKNPRKVDELQLDVRNQIYTDIHSPSQIESILLVILLNRHNMLGSDGQFWADVLGLQKAK